jgi:WhiB family transcriptional regulator, redox-sensing transcriptional regulator
MPASGSSDELWSRAACSTSDPDLFFPLSSAGPALRQVRLAKAICARCEIRQACLDYALDSGPIHGIWGGMTEEERLRLLRANAGRRSPAGSGRTARPGPSASSVARRAAMRSR